MRIAAFGTSKPCAFSASAMSELVTEPNSLPSTPAFRVICTIRPSSLAPRFLSLCFLSFLPLPLPRPIAILISLIPVLFGAAAGRAVDQFRCHHLQHQPAILDAVPGEKTTELNG